jgi:hypothetical protein
MSQPLFTSTPDNEKPNPTNVGGQAVIEGVMMRAPGALSVVCRKRDGSLILRERTITPPTSAVLKAPLIRGAYTLFSSLKIGHQALRFSAEILEEGLAEEEAREAEKQATERAAAKKAASTKAPPGPATLAMLSVAQWVLAAGDDKGGGSMSPDDKKSAMAGFAMALPILFAIGLFIALPQLAAEGINSWLGWGSTSRSPGSRHHRRRQADHRRQLPGWHPPIADVKPRISVPRRRAQDDLDLRGRRGAARRERAPKTDAAPALRHHVPRDGGVRQRRRVLGVGSVLPSGAGAALAPERRVLRHEAPAVPRHRGITFELQRFFARHCSTGPLSSCCGPASWCRRSPPRRPTTISSRSRSRRCAAPWREHAPVQLRPSRTPIGATPRIRRS